jgi:hypothetical protein
MRVALVKKAFNRKMRDALGGDRLEARATALNEAVVGPNRDIGC